MDGVPTLGGTGRCDAVESVLIRNRARKFRLQTDWCWWEVGSRFENGTGPMIVGCDWMIRWPFSRRASDEGRTTGCADPNRTLARMERKLPAIETRGAHFDRA
jgi:hypothetical protein